MATTNYLAMFTDVSGELVDSPAHFDGVATVIVDGGLTATGTALFGGLILPTAPPASVPSGSYGIYTVPGGAVYLYPPGGPATPLIHGTAAFVPRYNSLGDGLEVSRIQDTGGSSVDVLVPLTVLNLLRVQTSDVAPSYTDLVAFKDTIAGNYARWSVDKGTFSAYGPVVKLWSQVAGATLDLGSIPAGGDNAYSLNGDRGATISSDDRDVRGGLVFGLPSYSDIATGLSLGSAAYADTTDFDAAGAAATAEANAEAYADANFQPLGTLPAADADSATLGGVHSITSANDTYEATGVIVTLPSAGTYIVSGCARGTTQFSAGGSGALLAKLRDTTNAADLPNTVTRFAVGTLTGTRFDGNALLMSDPFTVAGSTDVELYVASTGAGTWTTRQVSTELTKVVAWKIGD